MRYYNVNTNRRHNQKAQQEMLSENKAATHYQKFLMYNLEEDDVVFLYESKVGIVALGEVGKGEVIIKKCRNDDQHEDGNEYYRNLNNFKILSQPLTFAKIKEITRKYYGCVHAMNCVSDDCGAAIQKFIYDTTNKLL